MKNIVVLFLMSLFINTSHANDKINLYQLPTPWISPDGKEVTLKSFAGQNVIIGMIFTACAHACPLTIEKVKLLLEKLKNNDIHAKVVLASFDIETDTPAHLKKYQESRKLDAKVWNFLSADKEEKAQELAVTLGISYKRLGKANFSHSNVITFLDKDGNVIDKIESLNEDIEQFAQRIKNKMTNKK